MQPRNSEECVLIVAPVGQDAPAMAALLDAQGFQAEICSGLREVLEKMPGGVGTLLLTDEALEVPQFPNLLSLLKAQPPWSELPVIILTKAGEFRQTNLLNLTAAAAGGLTLLERPISTTTL